MHQNNQRSITFDDAPQIDTVGFDYLKVSVRQSHRILFPRQRLASHNYCAAMTYESILYEVDQHVALLTLNRPERLNAWNTHMAAEIGSALAAAQADDEVRAVVLTGAGRAFCAGQDLSEGEDTFADSPDANPHEQGTPATMPWDVSKPVVAAINGHAVGVGLTFPLTCDIRFVAEDAKLQFAFVRRGIAPELGSTKLLSRMVGLQVASDLLMSGRFFSGVEAADIGLAARAVPSDEVLDTALSWAIDVANNTAPVSVAVTKNMMWENLLPEIKDTFRKAFFTSLSELSRVNSR